MSAFIYLIAEGDTDATPEDQWITVDVKSDMHFSRY